MRDLAGAPGRRPQFRGADEGADARPRRRSPPSSTRSAPNCSSEAQKQFLERADARFNQASEKSDAQLKALLQPVEATLKRYEEGPQQGREGAGGQLRGAARGGDPAPRRPHPGPRRDRASWSTRCAHSPKARGRWGEQSLKNVLEQAGLSPYADFQSEVSVDTEDGRLRPDVIVRLPGGRKLIIDAKCSLNAFLDASEEVDEAARDPASQGACRLDPHPRPEARLEELLGPVRRRRRLCRHVHSRRAFPDRRARAGRRPLGMGVRAPRAARHADQPRRHRPHRLQRLAAGEDRRGGGRDRPARQGAPLPPRHDGRPCRPHGPQPRARHGRLQRLRRQPRNAR